MFSYRICGIDAHSDIHLPGVDEPALPDATAQPVTIRRGVVPGAIAGAIAHGPNWHIAASECLIEVPDVARFHLSDGARITYAVACEAALADVPIFLLGTVFGMLLHQRERLVLHASAVAVDGPDGPRAVLFAGVSGAGKSTLAAALGARGFALVGDDMCALSLRPGASPLVHPDGRQLKLWHEAVIRLDLGERRQERVRPVLEKFYVAPSGAMTAPLPLGAIYVLREARTGMEPGIARANIVDAALLLRRNAYRPQMVRRLGQNASYFHAAAAIAGHAGIYTFTRKLGFKRMGAALDQLQEHWAQIGLAPAL